MSFDYHRKKEGGGDSVWTSYSDLFLGLSIVFLLLYVVASLKQGTDGIRQSLENKQLTKEVEDLRQQIKVYETLKQDYLKQQASADEQSSYQELMDKLDLLQDEQKKEKIKLRNQAVDNEKKEQALNKYQQLIRNIINSNMIAKSRIKSRDTMIDEKEEVIEEKSQEISDLEKDVSAKSKEIQRRESEMGQMEQELSKRLKQLRASYKAHQISKKKYEQQQASLKADADRRLQDLAAANANAKKELDQASRQLAQTNEKLGETEAKVAQLGQEKSRLTSELQATESKHRSDIGQLKSQFNNERAKEKAAFEEQLAKEKLSQAEKAAREAQFKADAEKKAQKLAARIADLDQKYKDSQGALAKAQENLNARKVLAAQIKGNFAKKGIKADVDEGTGDVLLSFGDEYFSTGQADLKPNMKKILEQAMPAYSASLFENDKTAKKIQSVEIVGFASPTYKGRYIDPASMNPDDREAINYNLDLSYNRARSIFNYVFDRNRMQFKHQTRLLPLVKVTGRSFLASDKARTPAEQTGGEAFCRKNDCAKLQRVIIKFTLKD